MMSQEWKRIVKMRKDSIFQSCIRDDEVPKRRTKVKDHHLEVGLIPASSYPSNWKRKSVTYTDVDSSERMMMWAAQPLLHLRQIGRKGGAGCSGPFFGGRFAIQASPSWSRGSGKLSWNMLLLWTDGFHSAETA